MHRPFEVLARFASVFFIVCMFVRSGPAAANDKDEVDRLLSGLRENREKLASGIFRATIEQGPLEGATGGSTKGKIWCAFDDSLKRFRHDESFVEDLGPAGLGQTRSDAVKFIRIPDRTIHFAERHAVAIDILPPDRRIRGSAPIPFDPRVLGLVSDGELSNGFSRGGFAASFESVFAAYSRSFKLEEVAKEPNGVWRVRFRFGPTGDYRKTLWIEPERGFSAVRMETHLTRKGTLEEKAYVVSTTEWKEVEDVWVPVRAEMQSRFNDRRMKIEITWEQVNEPVPDRTFTVDGLDVPKVVMWTPTDGGKPEPVQPEIVDYRVDPPLVLQHQVFFGP